MFLLDTNVVCELRRPWRADPAVLAWQEAVDVASCNLSAVTLFELRLGALRKQRQDVEQGAVLLRWIDRLAATFEARIYDVSLQDWLRCAELHVPDPRPLRDSLIAACALRQGLTVVTRNARDFAPMGVFVVNPWETRGG